MEEWREEDAGKAGKRGQQHTTGYVSLSISLLCLFGLISFPWSLCLSFSVASRLRRISIGARGRAAEEAAARRERLARHLLDS